MRVLTGHQVNPANKELKIQVMDEPGPGGAHHQYLITMPRRAYRVDFQNGPIKEAGVNGITHEALLAILIDRLECFQAGEYANDYNAAALKHLQLAQRELFDRTREREARGVEGTHNV